MVYARWQQTVVDSRGNTQGSATVSVVNENTGATATIYDDRYGYQEKDNPFGVDSDGFAYFYAPGGSYKITATVGAEQHEWRHVAIGLAQELDLPWFNIRAYGALGDGSTDDRQAIQDALDACEAAGGGVVYAPTGTYVVGQSGSQIGGRDYGLLIPSYVHLVGDGMYLTKFKADALTDMDVVTTVRTSTTYGIGLSHFTIDGAQDEQTDGGMNLWLYDVYGLYMHEIRTLGPGNWGMRLEKMTNFRIGSIETYHVTETNADGVHFMDVSYGVCGRVLCHSAGDDAFSITAHTQNCHDIAIGEVVIQAPIPGAPTGGGKGIFIAMSEAAEATGVPLYMYNITIAKAVVFDCRGSALYMGYAKFRNINISLVDHGSTNGAYLGAGGPHVAGYFKHCTFDITSWEPGNTGVFTLSTDGTFEYCTLNANVYNPGDGYTGVTLVGSHWNADIAIDYDPDADKGSPIQAFNCYADHSNIRVSNIDAGTYNMYLGSGAVFNTVYCGDLTNASTASVCFASGANDNLIVGGSRDSTISDSGDRNLVTSMHDGSARVLPGWNIIGASAVASSHTGDTNETTLATITIPGGTMGANGVVRITTHWTTNNNANAKTVRHRFGSGGTSYSGQAMANLVSQRFMVQIQNRNSEASQVGEVSGAGYGGWGVSTGSLTTSATNTANDTAITITGQLANAGDSITLEAYLVELFYQA